MTTPLLEGTDGVDKMSKSLGNYVGITDPPEEMFGKIMSIPDSALEDYWRLCLDAEPPEAEPMDSKLALAREPAGEAPFGLFSEAQVETSFEDSYRRIEDEARDIGDDLADDVRDIFDFFDNLSVPR